MSGTERAWMNEIKNRNSELFMELVPIEGKADTVAGELLRAVNHIYYRYENDGDRIGIASGKEYCNPAAFIDSNPGLTECNLSLMKCNFQLCALRLGWRR